MAGKRKRLTEFERGQIVARVGNGETLRSVAHSFGVAPKTCGNIYHRFQNCGNVDRKPGSGRPRKTTPRDDRLIIREVMADRQVTGAEIVDRLGITNLSEKSIRRRIKSETNLQSHYKVKKPFITPQNRAKRVAWAQEHLNWPVNRWKRVLWSDESPYVLRYAKRTRVWRTADEKYEPFATTGTVKHDAKINVWGCFCAAGPGRLFHIKGMV